MAVMGRRKKAVAQGWNAINKQRDEKTKKLRETDKKEEVTEEDHKERLKLLKDLGLVKSSEDSS